MNASLVYQSAMAAALAAPIESAADWVKSSHGFARIVTADGGAVYLKNAADRLREFADTVRRNWSAYGGGPKPAELMKPKKARAAAWPTVTVKVWRELIEAGEFSDAFALGSEKLGMRVYSGGRAAFAIVAPLPVDGLPADFASGRRDDGKYVVFDTVSGVAIGARGAASRKAAEESAVSMWADRTEEQTAAALRSARNMHNTPETEARAAWCAEHGIACDIIAPAADPEAAPMQFDPDPHRCMAAIVDAASMPDDAAPLDPEPEPEPAEPAAPTAPHPLAMAADHLAKRRAELAAAEPGAAGFERLMVEQSEKDHARLAAAFAVFDSIGDGAELSTADGSRYCVLLPDASEPGRYRYSVFNARGFYSHSTHNTAAEAVADAARAGFTVAAPGVLDRLAVTQEWAHGMAVSDVMQKHNGGRLSWSEACAEFDRLAAAYAKPAEPEPAAPDAPADRAPDVAPEPPAGLADTRAAMETARTLADAIDCAAASARDPRAASVRMLRSEAGRVRAAADTVPPGIARRYRMAAEMLKTLADSRDDAPAEIQPAAAVHRKPAAPIASRRPGRLAAREIRGAGFRPHRAAIAWHRAGRLAAAPRDAVHSIGCAGLAARAAPMAAPGPGARSAAGPGPPAGSTPLPADSRTPTARRFPRKPLTRFPQIPAAPLPADSRGNAAQRR